MTALTITNLEIVREPAFRELVENHCQIPQGAWFENTGNAKAPFLRDEGMHDSQPFNSYAGHSYAFFGNKDGILCANNEAVFYLSPQTLTFLGHNPLMAAVAMAAADLSDPYPVVDNYPAFYAGYCALFGVQREAVTDEEVSDFYDQLGFAPHPTKTTGLL